MIYSKLIHEFEWGTEGILLKKKTTELFVPYKSLDRPMSRIGNKIYLPMGGGFDELTLTFISADIAKGFIRAILDSGVIRQ